MRRAAKRSAPALAWTLLALLLVMHNDFWLWRSAGRWLGLPAGLTYHVLYCLATAGALAFLARVAWPRLDTDD